MECLVCHNKLTDDDLVAYKNWSADQLSGLVLVCKAHWCNCMPDTTPWRWVHYCDTKYCRNTICKSCYHSSDDGQICYDCAQTNNSD